MKEDINHIKEVCDRLRPLVAIRSITFNQEKFLRDTLEGFVMQQTNFPFVAIVHDDASTDGTTDILREYAEKYPDIILPIYEVENQYSKRDGSLGKIIKTASIATGAKYYGECEGDDYWIDPQKLQKQVDFLDTHPDYTLVAHNCIEKWEDGSREPKPYRQLTDGDVKPLDIFKSCPFQSASLMFRASIILSEKYNNRDKYKILGQDKWLMMTCSYYGKVYCFAEIMSVYRRHAAGASFANWNKHRIDSILERESFGLEFGDEIKEYADRSIAESLLNEILICLRKLQLKQSILAFKALKHSGLSKPEKLREFFRQLSLMRPFRYIFPRKK